MQRVIAQGDLRPIAGSDGAMDDLRRILREREASYQAADYILNTSQRDAEECIAELVDAVPQFSAPREEGRLSTLASLPSPLAPLPEGEGNKTYGREARGEGLSP